MQQRGLDNKAIAQKLLEEQSEVEPGMREGEGQAAEEGGLALKPSGGSVGSGTGSEEDEVEGEQADRVGGLQGEWSGWSSRRPHSLWDPGGCTHTLLYRGSGTHPCTLRCAGLVGPRWARTPFSLVGVARTHAPCVVQGLWNLGGRTHTLLCRGSGTHPCTLRCAGHACASHAGAATPFAVQLARDT